ncbi:myosin-IIIb isoform X1 [Pangasianodon hypophthalmus]|uniref:myosin-IIIb isoform X1 n=1 Tax=Pangasianodon hypophthalmus TaxID=310915 RepID=UPI0023075231|nr:myosin-IIIb isoform X1 [Pangasianodon hypophthalmus]
MEEQAHVQEDLASLADLDEKSLLESLTTRFSHSHIYTYIGDILVAVNPFKQLPLYGKEVSEKYKCHEKTALPPHIFAVADRAYQSMLGRLATGPKNQCIVISGESGAGKTESTKLLLRQLMELCRANSQLEQQILQVNPLLEVFGNAQTVMNDNSSRFGKYIQLRFQNSSVKGAKINEYLLEKSRVVHQDEGERNFHIFYCMLAGISSQDKEMYGLLDPSQYRYLNGQFGQGDMVQHWSEKYNEVSNAMDMVGFEEQEKVDMMTILAGILSLGNITFEPTENDALKVSKTSQGWLKATAGQFGVQEEDLMRCLTCTMSVTRGESIHRFHNQQQAEDARDSIAKVVYGRVFGWIVSKINELLAHKLDTNVELSEIGILDIFGFENFSVNRFEQLCINLANEQLQYFFNHHIFLMEQNEYKEEGIQWETITFKDNKPILDLFLTKPIGILSLLDEQSAFPQATDGNFVDKLNSKFKANPHFEVVRSHSPLFTVVHYAGKVQYNASGFLEKNRDNIPANIRTLFINSVTPLLSVLFAATISRTGTLMPRKAKMVNFVDDNFNSTRKQSVGTQFKHSLAVLMEKMFAASPHFVRCIKPNGSKLPDQVDSKLIMDQLRYNGLLETIRIRREGFSWRPTFKEFAQRYNILLLKPDLPLDKESCMSILNTTELHGWRCGSSRLFFKYWHQDELARLLERLGKAAVVIQKNYRAVSCRKKYLVLLAEVKRQQQAQREREEREEEERRRQELLEEEARNKRLLVEQENKRPVSPPVPLPRKKKPQPRPRAILAAIALAPHLTPVPRPRSKQFEATPFDNDVQENSDLMTLLAQEVDEEWANEKRKKRSNTIRWFKETQARKVAKNGTFPCWFHGMITRRQADDLLTEKPLGCFLIRVGQSREGYTLTYRGADRLRHYMIEMQSNGKYVILGEDRAHASLIELVQYHTHVGIKPFMERLTEPCGQTCDHVPDYEELKALLGPGPSDSSNTDSRENNHKDTDYVHVEMQRLFQPPGQTAELEAPKAPVLRRVSDRYRRVDDAEIQQKGDEDAEKGRPVPRLYPSIRLAMREIQQQFSANQKQNSVTSQNPWAPWRKKDS